LYSKQLISVTALLLSTAACSSNPPDNGIGGSSGTGASGGQTGTGGSHPGSGGTGGTTGTTGGTGGTTGTTGGTTGTTGGTGGSLPASGGSAGKATGGAGGSGAVPAGGTTGTTGGTGGALATGGAGGTTGGTVGTTGGTGGAPMGGAGGSGASGGSAGTGGSGTAGMPSSGGSGGGTAATCDNLSLAPGKTGMAKPSGAAGGLKVLDWAGFTGAVSYTFDDNTPSQMPDYSQLKATGGHFTWFVVGSWLSSSTSLIPQYKATLADGQEIASHTYSHNSAGSQSDLQQNETYLTTNFGVTANSMAAPNCDASWASVAPNIMFQNRGPCGTSQPTVSPRDSTSPFQLPAYLPDAGASATTLSGTYQTGKWRIFVIHGFDSQGGTYQPVPIANVSAAMTTAVSSGYWTEGITNVGAYWQGQKLISASATTNATWTLPAHFPKNMCVRITTSGGNVTQKGVTIPWDDHGYYQISLDAGEVTIQ
jgi:hypothetical protein